MKNIILSISCFLFFQQIYAQYTQVPDPNFEQALIDLGIDSEGILDGQFLTADAVDIEYLFVDNRNISNLIGIEAFVNLLWLDASNNDISQIDLTLIISPVFYSLNLGNNLLTTIDISPLPNILNIGLYNNNITTIDASNLTVAYVLSLANNPLTSINLNNTHIQILEFQNVLLTEIDLSTVQSLQKVYLQDSQIQSLDFTNNPILEEVRASNTPLASINLPNNPNLENLFVSNCQLTELDVTHCPNLIDLESSNNMLTSIDLSNNTLLEDLSLINNQLASIDLSNNPNIFRFWAVSNLLEGNLSFYENPILEEVELGDNLFTTIDLSQNNILEKAGSSDNPNLEMVNIKNGNNVNMSGLIVFNCPNLSCVVVDDPLADNDFILIEQNADINVVGNPEDCNLSISENELQQIINVFPNPVKNLLFIENSKNIEIEKITIHNILGKIILKENNSFNQLNLSNINNGILFVKIETENGEITKKIIKE